MDDRIPGSSVPPLPTHHGPVVPSRSLLDAVASGAIPGAVAVVTDAERDLFRDAFGYADPTSSRPFDSGDLFRIASAVKLWTSVLLMQLIEQEVVSLDDPLGHYLPEFDELPILVGFDGTDPVLVDPVRSPSIRETCAHLGGLSYPFSSELNLRYGAAANLPRGWGMLRALTDAPRIAQPGEKMVYGSGFDWIGLLIERITGENLEDRFRTCLLEPIGMTDTFYRIDAAAAQRVVPILSLDSLQRWRRSELGFDYSEQPEFCQGGGDLYTTASDYAKLMRVLLSGGQAGGETILSPSSVDQLFQPIVPASRIEQMTTAAPIISADIQVGADDRWGLGMIVNDHDIPGRRRSGSGGWAGLWNTFFWMDRTSGIVGALFMQYMPFCEPGAVHAFDAFERSAYARFGPAGLLHG